MIHVIGSGPAGVAAAFALVRAGKQVTLIDSGLDQDPANGRAARALGKKSPVEWSQAEKAAFRGVYRRNRVGEHLKTSAGSDYPYRGRLPETTLRLKNAHAFESHAIGGLSNVWGATLLPLRAEDLENWPISYSELEAHYGKISEFLPVAALRDGLAEDFPLFGRVAPALARSAQANRLLGRWTSRSGRLRQAGFRFGQSRLSVLPGCESCGLCTYSCPYGMIYSTRHTLTRLLAQPGFAYRGGCTVTGLRERGGAVELDLVDEKRTAKTLTSERVLVACGPIGSARLMLSSMQEFDTPIRLLQSQRVTLPFLLFARAKGAALEPHHALCQAFLELLPVRSGRKGVHVQFFGYNDIYRESLASSRLGRRLAIAPLLERAAALKCYFGSEVSPPLQVEIPSSNPKELRVTGRSSRVFRSAVLGFHAKLLANAWSLGGIALPLPGSGAVAGSGNHVGGSFPMSRAPSGFESDTLGRIRGFTRVHLVDSSVFPTLPASTLAYSVMANAHRIASRLAEGAAI